METTSHCPRNSEILWFTTLSFHLQINLKLFFCVKGKTHLKTARTIINKSCKWVCILYTILSGKFKAKKKSSFVCSTKINVQSVWTIVMCKKLKRKKKKWFIRRINIYAIESPLGDLRWSTRNSFKFLKKKQNIFRWFFIIYIYLDLTSQLK